MMLRRVVGLMLVCGMVGVGCGEPEEEDPTPDTGEVEDTGGDEDAGGEDDAGGEEDTGDVDDTGGEDDAGDVDDTGGEVDPWEIYAHPCVGNRTDALYCDDDQTCFVGCGTTTEGQGVFLTTDGGVTWEDLETDPAGVLEEARVNDISRSDDGLLYVAGLITGDTRVVSVADDGTLAEVWNTRPTVGFAFTAGSFRRASNGRAIAESLNGTDLVYRSEDGGDPADSWQSGAGFWSDGDDDDVATGVQIRQIEVYEDDFYGVGSLINQPPTIFLPKWDAETFDFHILQLNADGLGAFDGELEDIAINDQVVVAGGVNQDADNGIIYVYTQGDGEITEEASWNMVSIDDLFEDSTTWIHGVCVSDDAIYAVGRESSEDWGLVVRSTDGGETFEDITPYDGDGNSTLDPASACVTTADGIIVAGGGGMFAVFSE